MYPRRTLSHRRSNLRVWILLDHLSRCRPVCYMYIIRIRTPNQMQTAPRQCDRREARVTAAKHCVYTYIVILYTTVSPVCWEALLAHALPPCPTFRPGLSCYQSLYCVQARCPGVCLPSAYRLLTVCLPSAYRLLIGCLPAAYRLLTGFSLTYGGGATSISFKYAGPP